MTDPNAFTRSDTLAAREIVKTWLTPSFAKAVDAGELDQWGLMERARAQLLRQVMLADGEE